MLSTLGTAASIPPLRMGLLNLSIPSHKYVLFTASAVAVIVPLAVLGFGPYLRKPSPKPQRPPKPLPEGVQRVMTPEGLELLVAHPPAGISRKTTPIFLQHGGFGTAQTTYELWLPYFASKGRTVYALSLSGHGNSRRPSNFASMSVGDFSKDLQAGLFHARSMNPSAPPPVLIGHSAGGGVSQYTLSVVRDSTVASALICCGSYPPFGGFSVFKNWFLFDPWFIPRMILHAGDPKSPLSSAKLTRTAFFGDKISDAQVQEFHDSLNHEESMGWSQTMMFRFVDSKAAREHVQGKVFWVAGEKDALMTPAIMKKAAHEYGADMAIVPDAGHHMMNDVTWKEAADVVLAKIDEWGL